MKKEKKPQWKKGFRALRRHLAPHRKTLIILSVLGLLSAIANGFVPYITGRFFDALISVSQGEAGGGEIPLWAILIIAWAIIQLIANNVDWIMDRMRRGVTSKMHIGFQVDGFIQLYKLPLGFHKSARINELLEVLSKASWRISHILQTIVNVVPQFLSVIVGIVLAATINTTLAMILVLGVVLYSIVLARVLSPIALIDESAHEAWNGGWNDAAAVAHQIETMKQAGAEDREITCVKESLLGKAYGLWYKMERHWSNIGFYQRMIVLATQLAMFVLSVRFVANGMITVGELIALNGYAAMFFGPFVSFGYSWQTVQNGITTAAHAEAIFDEQTEAYDPVNAQTPETLSGEVEFKNVDFSYDKSVEFVLADVNFKVSSGETVALVGESGVGKSTAISLISGYYFPNNGSVYVDGIDTRNYNLNKLRNRISVVPQEVALFNESIKNNILYGSFSASDEEVQKAAEEAHIHKFIKKLPHGYDTLVGERGIKLSVGQKQRVAIARSMLRNPAILMLDEPTSALDAKTEKLLTESLEKLMEGRTTFIIAHRLSTVRKANRIFVFEKGKIVEEGTHKDLLSKEGGVYRHLYEYQIGLY